MKINVFKIKKNFINNEKYIVWKKKKKHLFNINLFILYRPKGPKYSNKPLSKYFTFII